MDSAEIERLHQLKEKGIITEEEFQKAKQKILDGDTQKGDLLGEFDLSLKKAGSQRVYNTAMHLSVLLGSLLPILGFAVPFVMWMLKKDSLITVDRHGRVVMNWVLSTLVFTLLAIILKFILVGFAVLWVLGIANVLFSLIGAYKAYYGELWKYPFSINFLRIPELKTQIQ